MPTTTLGKPEGAAAVALAAQPGFVHHSRGSDTAPILVVCDHPPAHAFDNKLPADMEVLRRIAGVAKGAGLGRDDFRFVTLCPPMAPEMLSSASRSWRHVLPYVPTLLDLIERHNPKCVVTFGNLAYRAVVGQPAAITKVRGRAIEVGPRWVLPMLSPFYVMRSPEHAPVFETDWHTLAAFKGGGWQRPKSEQSNDQYEWCEDLQELVDSPPPMIAVDTETTGLRWYDGVEVITVQISYREGHSLVVPLHTGFWPEWHGRMRQRAKLIGQLKWLLENPKIRKTGHNFKFDCHMLRQFDITVRGWTDDTLQLAFAVDENMMQKNIDECARRWVPEKAGYNDVFNQTIDKSKMLEVPRDQFLQYAGGDTDVGLRLYNRLMAILMRDERQLNCYRRIMMPALNAFAYSVEPFGMHVSRDRVREFGAEVREWLVVEKAELMRRIPVKLRRKWMESGERIEFSRTNIVGDILFTKDGFNLKPVVFTDSTKDLPEDQRVASTSSKTHLPFFLDHEGEAGEFVRRLIGYQKAKKLEGTFIGEEQYNNGIWQYLSDMDCIHPSYGLDVAVTGRTNSRDPNGQNFPKRGRWAKLYQSIFTARPGCKIIAVDLSQIELRIAAWEAMDAMMLSIYRSDGDIHTATAMAASRLTEEMWNALSKTERKAKRTGAKGINFGYLYGMWWKSFKSLLLTDYGISYTDEDARESRIAFFKLYNRLEAWHSRREREVVRDKQVRSLHGALRRLPSIDSLDRGIAQGAVRQAINSPVQRMASDLGLIAMVRFSQQVDPQYARILGFIHDALVLEVNDGSEQEAIETMLWLMENPPLHWFNLRAPLPFRAEAEIGVNAGDMLELGELPDREKLPEWFTTMGWELEERDGKLRAAISARKPDWWDDALDESIGVVEQAA